MLKRARLDPINPNKSFVIKNTSFFVIFFSKRLIHEKLTVRYMISHRLTPFFTQQDYSICSSFIYSVRLLLRKFRTLSDWTVPMRQGINLKGISYCFFKHDRVTLIDKKRTLSISIGL